MGVCVCGRGGARVCTKVCCVRVSRCGCVGAWVCGCMSLGVWVWVWVAWFVGMCRWMSVWV